MCPRATAAQHCAAAAAMASVCSFVDEEYIDLDLSSCGEFQFRVRRSGAAPADELLLCRGRPPKAAPPRSGGNKAQEADLAGGGGGRRSGAAPADELLLCRGRPPKAAPPRSGGNKAQEADLAGGGGGRRSAATVAPLQQHSHSAAGEFRDDDEATQTQPVARLMRTECSRRRRKAAARTVHAKLLASSRAFFRSLFARTSCSDERSQCRGGGGGAEVAAPPGETKSAVICKAASGLIRNGGGRAAPTTLRSSIEREKLMDEEELAAAARQRKSFSGVIKWRHTTTTSTAAAVAAPVKPLSSASARRSSGVCGGGPALKRSSSARSESEGMIQGAIAYCKRSQQQLGLGLARKSVSDATFCSASVAAAASWDRNSNPARSAVVAYCH